LKWLWRMRCCWLCLCFFHTTHSLTHPYLCILSTLVIFSFILSLLPGSTGPWRWSHTILTACPSTQQHQSQICYSKLRCIGSCLKFVPLSVVFILLWPFAFCSRWKSLCVGQTRPSFTQYFTSWVINTHRIQGRGSFVEWLSGRCLGW
jgi:hypothetical protein